jgi:Fe-S oxidoreductase
MEFGAKNIAFLIVFGVALAIFANSVKRLVDYLRLAKYEDRFDNIPERLINTFRVAIAQEKILREKGAGIIHALIFWGFLILLFSAVNSVLTGFGFKNFFDILGYGFSGITILTDIFALFIIVSVIGALYRRFVSQVKRLQISREESIEAGAILIVIFSIVTSLLIENATAIKLGHDSQYAVRPVSQALSNLFAGDVHTLELIYNSAWWVHIILIMCFTNFLPYSKHLHVLTSVINVFFSNYKPTNSLQKIDFEEEGVEKFGVSDVEDFSWKTILDGYTCTHCGRCTSVCPANQTGKVLDPREIIIQIRNRTMDKMPILLKQEQERAKAEEEQREIREVALTEAEQTILNKKLIGDYIDPEALWACTSCSACMQECPVNIEHVPAIINMRRSLVLMEADFPAELGSAFTNIENNSSPWAFPTSARADWAEGTGVKEASENPEFDILFWVGCAGSFDDRAKRITKAFASLMQIANINFAILGKEENCTGDPARRGGNEYLADMYVKMNVETMGNYNVKKIVTTCPHCFNTLKNEYPQFGGNYEVIHHTQFLEQLVNDGKIPLSKDSHDNLHITYHDSCYAGRLNNVYDEPRNLLQNVQGLNIIEPNRSKDKGFCCGAGGARMFMEETVGKRVNIERAEELLSTGAKTIALNCPFCMTMINDGVKAKEVEDVRVLDVSELILENVDSMKVRKN